MKTILKFVLAGMGLATFVHEAQSAPLACDFNGDEFNVSFFFPDRINKVHDAGNSIVPTPSVDPAGFGNAGIQIRQRSILISYRTSRSFRNVSYEGYVLTDLSRSNISSVAIDARTSVRGLDNARLTVTSNAISINMSGIRYRPGQEIRLNVIFSCEKSVFSKKEPPAHNRLG